MAYEKQTWVDRNVETPSKFTKSAETTASVTLTADPGTITQTGSVFSATRMTHLEGQYDAVKDELAAASGDISVDGSNLVDASVTAAKVAADVATQAELDAVSTVANAALPKAGGTMTGELTVPAPLSISAQSADEGGQINLAAATSGTLTDGVYIDIAGDSLRIFEGGGTNRGIILDISALAANVVSKFWTDANLANPAKTDAANVFTANQRISGSSQLHIDINGGTDNAFFGNFGGATGTKFGMSIAGRELLYVDMVSFKAYTNGDNEIWHRGDLRWSTDHLEYNDSGTWKAVGGVKSVQRGTVSVSGTTVSNVTISAVDMSKTMINLLGNYSSFDGDDTSYGDRDIYMQLTSTTNVKFTPDFYDTGGAKSRTVSYEVIEYY